MSESAPDLGAQPIAFEAFGVRVFVAADSPEALERLPALLPPGWRPVPWHEVDHRLAIIADPSGTYEVNDNGTPLIQGVGLELALIVLGGQLQARIALHAPDRIFVHAGVVAHDGHTIVVPGKSFTGKTTLVAALVQAGAIYYSDEFAVLDDDGLVHPYPKPLSLRGADQVQSDHDVDTLGGVAGVEPMPLGAVVVTTYRPGAEWRPQPLSPGKAVLALLANTVPARTRPAEALRAMTRAIRGTVAIESERGEADALAPRLLAELKR